MRSKRGTDIGFKRDYHLIVAYLRLGIATSQFGRRPVLLRRRDILSTIRPMILMNTVAKSAFISGEWTYRPSLKRTSQDLADHGNVSAANVG